MKQILILYFCYFEPMSLCYTNFTRNSGTVKVQGQLRPLFLILARSARPQYSTQYRARTPTVRRWRTQSRKGLCYSGPTTLNWFPGTRAVRAPPAEIGQKNILNWFADKTPDGNQLIRLIDSSTSFINRHTWFSRFVESVRLHWRSLSSINSPNLVSTCLFFNDCCEAVIISLQYSISYTL